MWKVGNFKVGQKDRPFQHILIQIGDLITDYLVTT